MEQFETFLQIMGSARFDVVKVTIGHQSQVKNYAAWS